MKKDILKPPITYYGGKQNMLKYILPLIPEHTLYCEPFAGGGAVFFSKAPSEVEVLNDLNKELMNFYKVVQNDFLSLEKKIRITLHSRQSHGDARVIYSNPHLFSDIDRAWAVWVLSCQSFSSMLNGTWGYDKTKNTTTKKIINNRGRFTDVMAIRLQNVQLECADALYIIQSRDTENSFFYCDPPYYNSDCGHYAGYTEADFEALLKKLSGIKGKFLLSSYPSDLLKKYVNKNDWFLWSVELGVSVNAKSGYRKRKTEVITSNFRLKS